MQFSETVLNNILNRMAINFRLEQRINPVGQHEINELELMKLTHEEIEFLKRDEQLSLNSSVEKAVRH